MPQYPAYGSKPVVDPDDLLLWWGDSEANNVKQKYSEFLDQIQDELDPALAVSIPTSGITLDASYEYIEPNSGSPMTITVPLASSFPGQQWRIFNKGTGDVTLQRTGGDTIAGATALVLAQYESVIIISDGVSMYGTFGAP